MVKHKDPQLHAHIKTRMSYTIPLFLATQHYLTSEKIEAWKHWFIQLSHGRKCFHLKKIQK